MRLALFMLLLATFSTSALSQTRQDPDYVAGYDAWSRQRWPTASERLSRYWVTQQYSRTYDVAYWLGTSWCRQQGRERDGVDMLDWSYHYQSMPEQERGKFRAQRDLCISWLSDTQTPRAVPIIIVAATRSNATMRAEGKTYYMVGDDNGGLSYPVRLKRKLPDSTFESRLIKVGEPAAITSKLRELAPGATLHVGRYTAIASFGNHTPVELDIMSRRLDDFVNFMKSTYQLPEPQYYMTIYLTKDIPTLRRWADTLHGFDASPRTLGYSLQNDLSVLAMQSGTQTGTVLHEISHLLIRGAYGDAPQWLDEGIASLYETSTLVNGTYYGEPNWRSRVLSNLGAAYDKRGLADVIASPWFSDEPALVPKDGSNITNPDEQAYLLAYSRVFALYLQEKGLLRPMFAAFKNRTPPAHYVPAPTQALQLVEKTAQRSVGLLQDDLKVWFPTVANPDRRLHEGEHIDKELPGAAAPAQ